MVRFCIFVCKCIGNDILCKVVYRKYISIPKYSNAKDQTLTYMIQKEKICPVEHSVNLLGGKWKLPIIHALVANGVVRFKELERIISGITPKMLTTQLRSLEADGLVERKVYATVPPTVEYKLTEIGKSIRPMILELEKWGLYHQQICEDAEKKKKKKSSK
jgi:DNA-binding HxlR family transcriptional regulator